MPLSLRMSSLKKINTSVRQLDIQGCESFINEEEEDWNTLIHSSLVARCKVLFVQIDNRENIINLIDNLNNL
jgi:hypothetical protein